MKVDRRHFCQDNFSESSAERTPEHAPVVAAAVAARVARSNNSKLVEPVITRRTSSGRAIGILVASTWLLCACTSSLVLGTAYNAAANKTADRVKTYADFDENQQQWIEQSFKSFQQWHRITELPTYSVLLDDVANTLKTNEPIQQQQLNSWFETIEERTQRARSCSPLMGAAGFLTDMADWQVKQMNESLRSNRLKQYKKYKTETVDERRERRLERIITWASRAGIKLNDGQKQLLETTLSRQTSMGDRRFQLWEKWTSEFTSLLEQRDSEQFADRLQSHIDSLWGMTERTYPKEWKQNRDLWQNFTHTLLNDLSVDQKTSLANTIASISKSTLTLSRKKSRAKPVCFSG